MKALRKILWMALGMTGLAGASSTAYSVFAASGEEGAPSSFAAPTGEPRAQAAGAVGLPSGGDACIADNAAIEDIRRRREELDARDRDLQARETDLKAREQAVGTEMKKLEEARAEISRIDTVRRKENEDKVTKLVETFETMSPKASSQILSQLDEGLAVAAMSRIATPKLAKIMNTMEPGRSSKLSELMAGVVRARGAPLPSPSEKTVVRNTASDGVAATAGSRKGGESTNDANSRIEQTKQSQPNRQPTAVGESRRSKQQQPGSDQAGKPQ